MKLQRFFGNRRMVYWFTSYILIAFCTIAFNFIAYVQIDKNISMQNDHYAGEILQNKKNRIDSLVKITENFAREVSKNDSVRNTAFFTRSIAGEDYSVVLDVVKSLKLYRGIEYGFDKFYIYFHNIDYCIWDEGANSADTFFDVQIAEEGFSKKEWFKLIKESHSGEFIVSPNGEKVCYLMSVYGNERFIPYATVVVEVNVDDFLLSTENERFNEGFYVVGEDGVILLTDDTAENSKEMQRILEEKPPTDEINAYKDKTVITARSESSGLTYMYYIDKGEFRQAVNRGRLIIVLCNIVCLLVVIIIACGFSRRNYRPIKSIMRILGDNAGGLGDEFNYIEKKINDVIEENKELSEMSEKIGNKSVKSTLVSRLLSSELYDSGYKEVMETLECLDVSFGLKCFLVILFYVDISSEMFFEKNADRVEENYSLAKLVIQNVFGELLGTGYNIYFCDINGFLGCVVNMKNEDADTIVDRINWMQKFVIENFNIREPLKINSQS